MRLREEVDRNRLRPGLLPSVLVISLVMLSIAVLGLAAGDDGVRQVDARLCATQSLAPSANAGPNRTVIAGEEVIFNGSQSTSTATILNYTWSVDEGVGVVLYGLEVTHVFMTPGSYNVTLNITDSDGLYSEDSTVIVVGQDTEAPVANAGRSRSVTVGTRMVLSGNTSTDNSGRIRSYNWTVNYGGAPVALSGQYVGVWFNSTGAFVVTLTVTDYSGLANSTTITITVTQPPTWVERNLFWIVVLIIVGGAFGISTARKLYRDRALVTPTDIEKAQLLIRSILQVAKQFRKNTGGVIGLTVLVMFVMIAVFSPLFLDKYPNPNSISWSRVPNSQYLPPSSDHWFGTDFFGRDIYSLTVLGSRASLIVGFLASVISILLGTAIGLAAGYFGKLPDEILMRVTDFFLVIPWFPLMIVFATVMGRSFENVIIVIGITSWPSTSRIVRAQVLSLREKTFIERAISVGAGSRRIISKHILPNVFPLIFANTILLVANSIFSESFLDFFGLGDPSVISWGTVLEFAYEKDAFSSFAWWTILAPGLCIIVLIMSFYMMGDALDEVLNPKLRKR